jgi:hypothetical protein
MLNHWLIDLIGHVSGLSDAQLRQIEKSLPATKALIDLLNRAQPIIGQAQSLYAEAEPLIDQAKKEWQTVGPAAQILMKLKKFRPGDNQKREYVGIRLKNAVELEGEDDVGVEAPIVAEVKPEALDGKVIQIRRGFLRRF